MATEPSTTDYYGAHYRRFAERLYAEIRAEAFGEDIGQNSWLTAEEQDLFLSWLGLTPDHVLLDVACGSGGPSLRAAQRTGCSVHGIDVEEAAIREARARASASGQAQRVRFEQVDAAKPLPFDGGCFDVVWCVDAIIHFPHRDETLGDWARILRPGGSLMFTDSLVVTGPLTNEEVALRSLAGLCLFAPAQTNERLLDRLGFALEATADRTENMAQVAERRYRAREARAEQLRRIEGEDGFLKQQRFLQVAARLAAERRLSRLAFHARRVDRG